ncbi:hypothetical protein Tco_1485324 [Tanacetum coccineum]
MSAKELVTIESKEKLLNHTGVGSWFTNIKQASNSFECDERIIWVSIEVLPIKAWTSNSFHDIINERRKIIVQGKVFWIRAKELNAWVPTFLEDNQDDSLSNDESKENVVEDIDGDKENKELSDVDRVSKSSFSHANDLIHENSYSNKTVIQLYTAYGSKRIRRIGNWSNAFSCEELAPIRRIFLVGYGVYSQKVVIFKCLRFSPKLCPF